MTDREQIIYERLLCLAANEYGKTREEMLAWINDDSEDWRTDYPTRSEHPPDAFVQRSRISNFVVLNNIWLGNIVSKATLATFSDADRRNMTTEDLAWLVHEAEYQNDDVSMMILADVARHRPDFGEVYRGIWPQHAKARGYHQS